jgi:hypothetical protein
MIVDPITEEIRAIRHALAAQYGNDLNRIFDALQDSERESGRQFISLPMRPPRTLTGTRPLRAPGMAGAPDGSELPSED